MVNEGPFDQFARTVDYWFSRIENGVRRERERFPERMQTARTTFDGLKSDGNDAWNDLKPGLKQAWIEVRQSVSKAASRFKNS